MSWILKRFIVCLLCVLLVSAAAVSAFAAGTPRFYVEAPSSAKVGDTITVSVKLSGEYTAHLITLHFSYDPNSFEYVSHKRGEVLAAASEYGMAICEKAADRPVISVGVLYAGEDGLSAEGTIVEAKFKVLSTASGSPAFTLEVPEFGYMPLSATTSTPIQHTVENASVSISGGSGAAPTNTPVPVPGQTTAPHATTAPGITEVPSATEGADHGTEPAGTENAQPANTEAGETGEPGPTDGGKEPDATKAAEAPDASEQGEEPGTRSGSGALKGVLIGLGCLLAVGLGWLGVHFLKKAREAGQNR